MANPLREAVKSYFYPFAESKGFVRAKSKHPHFTTFRRVSGTTVHVFDVQWDKYGRPAFVINFGEASIDQSQVSAAEIESEQCKVLCRLQPDKNSARWWRLTKPWREVLRTAQLKYEPNEVVSQVIACFPDAEAWWADKQEGPHVQVLRRAG